MIVRNLLDREYRRLTLVVQEIPQSTEERYLGVTVTSSGFVRKVDSEALR